MQIQDEKTFEDSLVKRLGINNWFLRVAAVLIASVISWGTYELIQNRSLMTEALTLISQNQQEIAEVKKDVFILNAAQRENFDNNDWYREEQSLKRDWKEDVTEIKEAILRLENKQ